MWRLFLSIRYLSTLAVLLLLVALPPLTAADGKAGSPPLVNSIGMKFQPIPAGEFQMGSTDDFGRFADEHQHKVRITKPFYMGAYEVTQEQFEKVMGNNPSYFSKSGEGKAKVAGVETGKLPVESVTWEQAVEFAKRLSALPEEKKAGRTYRLPTEAEWEYACRAGTTTPFHYGESLSSRQANFDGNTPYLERDDVMKGVSPDKLKGPFLERTARAGSYEPNAWGLYDMHGNAWEWVADWYSPVYFKDSPAEDPKGPESGSERVLKGGSWYYFAAAARCAARQHRDPAEKRNTHGFRVVCEAKQ